jgi:signal peptidase II
MELLSNGAARLVLAAALCASCIGCDQVTKSWATRALRGQTPQSYFADTVRLHYAQNSGGLLSFGSTFSPQVRYWLFIVPNVVFLATTCFVLVFRRRMTVSTYAAAVLLAAGAAGNLIDRVSQNGLVTDFLNVGIGPLRTGIFNVADMAIMGAVGLLMLPRGESPEEPAAAAE